jgi:pyridoxine/pyridoxamine 5'-phosphate oxidase
VTAPFDATDPIDALRADRAAARAAEDPAAALCAFATGGKAGPAVRTLVLRELDDGRLAVFVNRSGAKAGALAQDPRFEAAVWLPSLQRQWRVRGVARELPGEVVEAHWDRRPRVAQLMDHLYAGALPQGAALEDRSTLLDALAEADARLPDPTPVAPVALALALEAERIECLQIAEAPDPHRRRTWRRTEGGWRTDERVP